MEVAVVPGVRRVQLYQIGPATLMIKTGSNAGRILGRHGLATVAAPVSNDPSRWERSRRFLQVCWQGTRRSGMVTCHVRSGKGHGSGARLIAHPNGLNEADARAMLADPQPART